MRKIPFALQWHITDKCNQRCKHCYIYEGKEKTCISRDLSLKSLENILENFIESCDKLNRKPAIYITGGDPLLYPDIWNFLRILKEKKLEFCILGNPFHLNLDIIKCLEDFGCVSYQMSLDGLRETHDKIRKRGSFDATISSLEYFKESNISVAIMATVSKTNIQEIPDLVDIVVKNKVKHFGFARYCPNQGDFEMMASPEEYREFLEKMWKKFEQYHDSDTEFVLKDHLWKLFLYEKGLFNPKEIYNPNNLVLDGCHCGSHITVLPNGEVYACRRSYTSIGKVPEESFYDIITGSNMEKYCQYDKFEYCADCELKNFCRGCPSVAKCLTGDFYAKDPQCWKK